MDVYENSCVLATKNLSAYALELDNVSRSDYINKLSIKIKSGKILYLPDPYFLEEKDFKNDTSLWPTIRYPDIYGYLRNSSNPTFSDETLRNYKALSAYEYVVSGKVQTIQIHIPLDCPDVSILYAEVQPSQRISEKNHKAWVLVESSGSIRTAHCTCMAGIGESCSHIAALLFKVELAASLNYTKERAPTEEACKWNSTFSSKKVQNVPLTALDFSKKKWHSLPFKKRRKVNCLSCPVLPSLTSSELQSLKEINPNAAFFKASSSTTVPDPAPENIVKNLPPPVIEILQQNNIDDFCTTMKNLFNASNCILLESETIQQFSCKLWHDHRCGRLTASLFKEVVKRKKWDSEYMKKFISPSSFSSTAMHWGKEKEETALKMYEEQHKGLHQHSSVRKAGLVINPEMPHLGASPDAFVNCSCCGKGIIEIKCPYKHRENTVLIAAKEDKTFCLNSNGILKESHSYYYQIQGQMAVAAVDYCDFVVWTTKDFLVQRIKRNVSFFDDLKPMLDDVFFFKVVPFLKDYVKDGCTS